MRVEGRSRDVGRQESERAPRRGGLVWAVNSQRLAPCRDLPLGIPRLTCFLFRSLVSS